MARRALHGLLLGLAGCAHLGGTSADERWACSTVIRNGQGYESCDWKGSECQRWQDQLRRELAEQKEPATFGACVAVPVVWCFRIPKLSESDDLGGLLECKSTQQACEQDRSGWQGAVPCQPRTDPPEAEVTPEEPLLPSGEEPTNAARPKSPR